MKNWRNIILQDFAPNITKLTLVSDPDDLLTEEKLVLELRNRGFDIVTYSNSVEFRYLYESKLCLHRDRKVSSDIIVLVNFESSNLSNFPYDLLQVARKLSFSLGDIFPHMSYSVIAQLDRGLLDVLFTAQHQNSLERMGDNATKDFILRYVYKISVELICSDVDMIRFLLRLHYANSQVPQILKDRILEILQSNQTFAKWSLVQLINDSKQFFLFLQERWPIFLQNYLEINLFTSDDQLYSLKLYGPAIIPFDHPDIKVYIDNLFVEGKLSPIELPNIDLNKNEWVLCGVLTSQAKDLELRIIRLFELISDVELSCDLRYVEWIEFATKWAELSSLVHKQQNAEYKTQYKHLSETVNDFFANWLKINYNSLITLPPTSPVMLHHIPRYLARQMENNQVCKVALLVIDGLALDQWVTIKNIIQKNDKNLVLRETAVFAWIPTLTSVSRQAIFSGRIPSCFPSSIKSTNNEEKMWRDFWQNNNISKHDIVYCRGLGDGEITTIMERIINPETTKVVGLVIDKVDKIMHGMQLGASGMHNQISQWCNENFLLELIHYLLDQNYDIWLTSDHGNIESIGRGKPSEGAIAETRGERVRIYPTNELLSQVSSIYTFADSWEPFGLPENYYPLITKGNDAFINIGERIVAHGGIAIEEVLVPLVKIERRTQ